MSNFMLGMLVGGLLTFGAASTAVFVIASKTAFDEYQRRHDEEQSAAHTKALDVRFR